MRASDILRSPDQMERALSAAGQPTSAAAVWTHGAIRFRKEHDKRGIERVAPITAQLRAALDAHLAAHPCVGDAPLIPATADPSRPAHKMLALYWLQRAEKRAELPKLEHGGYHPLRRLWASERRHLSPVDVAAAGGWQSIPVMQTSYQHADASSLLSVMDNAHRRDRGHTTSHACDAPTGYAVVRRSA